MSREYSYNYDILCAACDKPRYFGYTDLPDSEMCCCHGQDKIPTYDKRLGELPDEALLYASEEDWAFYRNAIEGLPTREGKNGDNLDKFWIPIPYHSGPHILRHFREVIEIVQPKALLEVGFNMGHSAAMWLNLTSYNLGVISLDVSEKEETLNGAAILENNYPSRFSYINRNSKRFDRFYSSWMELPATGFDLCFIDGAHDEKSIIEDTEMCINLKIPYIFYDDWYPRYGETQKAVAEFPELELVKDMNNLRLYKVNY